MFSYHDPIILYLFKKLKKSFVPGWGIENKINDIHENEKSSMYQPSAVNCFLMIFNSVIAT